MIVSHGEISPHFCKRAEVKRFRSLLGMHWPSGGETRREYPAKIP